MRSKKQKFKIITKRNTYYGSYKTKKSVWIRRFLISTFVFLFGVGIPLGITLPFSYSSNGSENNNIPDSDDGDLNNKVSTTDFVIDGDLSNYYTYTDETKNEWMVFNAPYNSASSYSQTTILNNYVSSDLTVSTKSIYDNYWVSYYKADNITIYSGINEDTGVSVDLIDTLLDSPYQNPTDEYQSFSYLNKADPSTSNQFAFTNFNVDKLKTGILNGILTLSINIGDFNASQFLGLTNNSSTETTISATVIQISLNAGCSWTQADLPSNLAFIIDNSEMS